MLKSIILNYLPAHTYSEHLFAIDLSSDFVPVIFQKIIIILNRLEVNTSPFQNFSFGKSVNLSSFYAN